MINDILKAKEQFEKTNDKYYAKIAEMFLSYGIELFPSTFLKNNQYIVSQKLYDAIKKAVNEPKLD